MAILAAALLVVGSPAAAWVSVYSSLAVFAALGALRLVLVWIDGRDDVLAVRGRRWALVGVGAACGMSFCSKPNVGLLALAAVVVSVAVNRSPTRTGAHAVFRDAARVGGGFVAPVTVTGVALLASGAWNSFVSDVFGDKVSYLEVGVSYLDVLERQLDVLVDALSGQQRALAVVQAVAVLLPVVTVAIAGIAFARSRGEARRTS